MNLKISQPLDSLRIKFYKISIKYSTVYKYYYKRMDFIRRVGTARHKYKLQFFLKNLYSDLKIQDKVYIAVKRGNILIKIRRDKIKNKVRTSF